MTANNPSCMREDISMN